MIRLVGFLRGDDLAPELRDGGAEVRLAGVIVLVGTLTSILFHLAVVLLTDKGWPYTTFLFKPEARFFDYLEVYANAREFGVNGSTNVVYSGPLHLLMYLVSRGPSLAGWLAIDAVFVGALVLVVWSGVTARVGGRRVRYAYAGVFCILSYPVLFLLDRANLEMVVFALLATFVYLYFVRRSPWAWLPLSLAIAGKYFWIVFLVLLATDRQWRQLVLTAVAGIVVTLISFIVLGVVSGLGFAQVVESTLGTLGGHAGSATTAQAVQHGHSFFAVPYFIDRSTGYWLQMHASLGELYVAGALAILLIVAVRLTLYDLEPWRKLTALVICAIALPFESHDYTLVHLLLPLALLGAWGAQSALARRYAILFGLLLVPLDYLQYGAIVNFSSLVYALLLLILLLLVLSDRAVLRVGPSSRRLSSVEPRRAASQDRVGRMCLRDETGGNGR